MSTTEVVSATEGFFSGGLVRYFGSSLQQNADYSSTRSISFHVTKNVTPNYELMRLHGSSGSGNPQGYLAIGINFVGFSQSGAPANGLIVEGYTGIGTASPSTALEVSGTVSTTAVQIANAPSLPACGPGTYGTIKIVSGRQYTCRP